MLLETTLEKVGRVLSKRYGITLICRGKQCCTDGNTIILPSLPDTVPEHLMPPIRAYLDHEVGHVVGATDFPLGKIFREEHGEAAFGILNLLEDLRTDAVMRSRYPGSARNLSTGFTMTLQDVKDASAYRQVVIAMYALGSGYAMPHCVSPEMRTLAESMRAMLERAKSAPDTKTLVPDALAIWEKVKVLCEAKHKEQAQQQDGKSRNGFGGRQASGQSPESQENGSCNTGEQTPESSGQPSAGRGGEPGNTDTQRTESTAQSNLSQDRGHADRAKRQMRTAGRVHCLSLEQLARKYPEQLAVPPAPHLVDAKELVEMDSAAG